MTSYPELLKRPNLYDDDDYEDFRDEITDTLSPGFPLTKQLELEFGARCRIQVISEYNITAEEDLNILASLVDPWALDIAEHNLFHTKLLLHMQAEANIKIDVIWAVNKDCIADDPHDRIPVAMFFEDTGQGAFDDGPNFEPSDNSNWSEFLYDMGLGPNPFGDGDEMD
ncbi:hypothetical protein LY10_01182 [Planktotalea frisia]|uniref:Uncharacterized protein n=1 Tax=Planktotalea frisia TaxID=696762 RepID=A0A1L9P0L2_9RHOB|nr:hypothetical protein [Planktotalea frisia]OJI95021.1 hypothetical protein PFRI_07290 [Planktotalea frisia]PZX31570.1 hypothetical protein LY10_01182 [Planktotalea frisia]